MATAAALAEELRRYLAGEPIVARPVTRFERAVKWTRRKPAIAALLGLVALAWIPTVPKLLTNSREYCAFVDAMMLVFHFTPRPAEVPE